MEYTFKNISDHSALPVPATLTPEEEAAAIAQYKAKLTLEALNADYKDIDKQIAEGVSAEVLLKELQGH